MLKAFLSVFFTLSLFLACMPAASEEGGRAYYDLGVFAFEDGDYGGALENFEKARSFDPANPYYNHYLGKTLMQTERPDEAGRFFAMAESSNPDMPGLKHDIALLRYKSSDYPGAAAAFTEIADKEPGNINAVFYAGMSNFQMKRYGEAETFFNRAAETNPAIKPGAWYYAGICNAKSGRHDIAKERFEYVRDNADSEQMRRNAEKWLKALKRGKRASKPYSVFLSASYEYDDNVRLDPMDDEIGIDDHGSSTDKEDFLAKVYLSGSYNFVNGADFKMGAGYSHYQTWHNDLTEYDLMGCIGNLKARYGAGAASFGLAYSPSYYTLDGDEYMTRHKITPDIAFKIDDGFVSFSYSYSDNDYELDTNDGHTNEIAVDFYYPLGKPGECVMWQAGAEKNTAESAAREYTQLKTKLDAVFSLPLELYLGLTGKYTNRHYDGIAVSSAKDGSFYRIDVKYFGAVSLSRKIVFDWLTAVGEASYTRNDSNHRDYDYEKYTGTLSLEAKF